VVAVGKGRGRESIDRRSRSRSRAGTRIFCELLHENLGKSFRHTGLNILVARRGHTSTCVQSLISILFAVSQSIRLVYAMAPPRRKAGRIQKQITSIGNAIYQSNQAFKDSKRAMQASRSIISIQSIQASKGKRQGKGQSTAQHPTCNLPCMRACMQALACRYNRLLSVGFRLIRKAIGINLMGDGWLLIMQALKILSTYDHRSVRTGHPVRSAIHKH
jgi:hypothetical protein